MSSEAAKKQLISAAKQVKTCDIAGPQAFLDFGSWDCKGNAKASKCDFIVASDSECVKAGAVCSNKGKREEVKKVEINLKKNILK